MQPDERNRTRREGEDQKQLGDIEQSRAKIVRMASPGHGRAEIAEEVLEEELVSGGRITEGSAWIREHRDAGRRDEQHHRPPRGAEDAGEPHTSSGRSTEMRRPARPPRGRVAGARHVLALRSDSMRAPSGRSRRLRLREPSPGGEILLNTRVSRAVGPYRQRPGGWG